VTAVEPAQLALGGMPRRLFSCTPSRLAAFDCPRRYRMQYLDRPAPAKGPPWAHNTLGAVVHLALARWWGLESRRRTPDAAAFLVERNWESAGFRDDDQSAHWRAVAQEWVRRYVAARLDPEDEPVGVERTVSTKTDALVINGRVDRIDDRGDELVVVDYKAGRHECTDDDARGSQALALYVLAARRTLRRACRRVELHHVPTGTVAAFEHTDESLARHVERAEASAQDIVAATDTMHSGAPADAVFPPAPSPSCSWCDFRDHCPEGRAASADIDPWAGLADA
jgi:putative RecB family exonuclease